MQGKIQWDPSKYPQISLLVQSLDSPGQLELKKWVRSVLPSFSKIPKCDFFNLALIYQE
jgi:hypothetical protein